MKRDTEDKALKDRIRAGTLRRGDVIRRLGELAFGRANDCVRLVLEENTDLKKLDLSLLSEVKRSEKGAVEVKLADRLLALRQLTELTGEDGSGLEAFLQAMEEGGAE